MFHLDKIIRRNISTLVPYACARDEFNGSAEVFLDANESPFKPALQDWPDNAPWNRYPDAHQSRLKQRIAAIKSVAADNIFLGNGSDECIDVLYKSFCDPGTDNVIICPPTYGMYEVAANICNVEVRSVPLQPDFQPDLTAIAAAMDEYTKITWICSPNNPTGNTIDPAAIRRLLQHSKGLVVLDEAYTEFAPGSSWLPQLADHPNLVILQTFSKAWAMAALRLGMAFAAPEIISIFNKVKPPYNISTATQAMACEALQEPNVQARQRDTILRNRVQLAESLLQFAFVKRVFPSAANFLLVQVTDATVLYRFLCSKGIIVRDRSRLPHCSNCLRISVGTASENQALTDALHQFQQQCNIATANPIKSPTNNRQ